MRWSAADWEIDAEELRALFDGGASQPLQLVDVREAWERAEAAISPSLHLPLEALEESSTEVHLSGLRPGVPTVVYCSEGVRSLRAVSLLRARHGFSAVLSLRGGMDAWRALPARG